MNIQTAMFFQLNIPMIIKYDLNNYTYRKLLIDMEISYLNEFIVLAKYQNYFKASQELYIAQSTLSKHIVSLENECGYRLIDRANKQFELTESGKLFLHYAKIICQNYKDLSKQLEQQENDNLITINLGASRLMIEYGITNLISKCVQKFSNVRFRIHEGSEQELAQLINEGKIDISFLRSPHPPHDNHSFTYIEESLCAIVHESHPLAYVSQIDLSMLENEQLYLPPEFALEHQAFLNYCEEQQFYPLISFTAPRIENLLEMVNTNNGVVLIMEQQANYYVTSPLKIVQLNSPIKLYINVNVHNHLIASKEVAYLLELAKKHRN